MLSQHSVIPLSYLAIAGLYHGPSITACSRPSRRQLRQNNPTGKSHQISWRRVKRCQTNRATLEEGLIKHHKKDIEFTHVISANGINFLNFVAECHCLVNEKLKEIMRGRFPRQKLKLRVDSATPGRHNPDRNLPSKSATWRLVRHITYDYCSNRIQI
jgi:hypothetical protein